MPSIRRRLLVLGIWLLAGLAVLAISIVAYGVIERESGRIKLRDVRKKLEVEGILRPLSQITPRPSKEAIANGQKLQSTIEGLHDLTKANPAVTEGPEVMRITSPGVAAPAASEPVPVFESSGKSQIQRSWEDLRNQLDAGSEILDKARSILKKPVALEYEHSSPKAKNSIGQIQDLTAWLRATAVLKLHCGDTSGAIDNLDAICHLATLVGESASLTRYVLNVGIWSYGASGLFWEILQSGQSTESDLSRLDEIASRGNFVTDALRSMKVELAIVPRVREQVTKAASPQIAWALIDEPSGALGSPQAIWLRNAAWPLIWSDGDMARISSFWGSAIKRTNELLGRGNWLVLDKKLSGQKSQVSNYNLWRFPFTNACFEVGFLRTILHVAIRAEMRRQLTLTAIALERYRLKNDHLPDRLELLIPDYLKALPHDWFDGGTLKYRWIGTNRYLIYSVGENGIDDGGDATSPMEKTKRGINDGLDLVWPCAKAEGNGL